MGDHQTLEDVRSRGLRMMGTTLRAVLFDLDNTLCRIARRLPQAAPGAF